MSKWESKMSKGEVTVCVHGLVFFFFFFLQLFSHRLSILHNACAP